jgi:hypothetical protein
MVRSRGVGFWFPESGVNCIIWKNIDDQRGLLLMNSSREGLHGKETGVTGKL